MTQNIKIDNPLFEVRNNVKSQAVDMSTSELFFKYHDLNSNNGDISYFLLFETSFDSAFAHWIYESAIYLFYFFELKAECPKLKILVKQNPKRSYKKLFFKALNINENDIYWIENEESSDCRTIYDNIPINNICINTKLQCMNTININTILLKELVINFRNKIINNLNIVYPEKKTIEYLFFPRSKIENYSCNDRIINYDAVYAILEGKEHVIHDTINTINLKDQIELLISSNTIFLDWGSSMLVNGIFCKNSNILISDALEFQRKYKWFDVFFEIAMENNNNFIKIY
jgi:hypothetical protein